MRVSIAVLLMVTGCGHYRDFTLPEPTQPKQEVKFRWEPEAEPVLLRGAQVDVLNPAIVRWQGALLNLYSNFDGKIWHTSAATSQDGKTWRQQGVSISPDPATWEGNYIAANGAVLAVNGELLYWYQAGGREPQIGLAKSKDGHTWTKHPQPVLPKCKLHRCQWSCPGYDGCGTQLRHTGPRRAAPVVGPTTCQAKS